MLQKAAVRPRSSLETISHRPADYIYDETAVVINLAYYYITSSILYKVSNFFFNIHYVEREIICVSIRDIGAKVQAESRFICRHADISSVESVARDKLPARIEAITLS